LFKKGKKSVGHASVWLRTSSDSQVLLAIFYENVSENAILIARACVATVFEYDATAYSACLSASIYASVTVSTVNVVPNMCVLDGSFCLC
jgi:hypothetical protein